MMGHNACFVEKRKQKEIIPQFFIKYSSNHEKSRKKRFSLCRSTKVWTLSQTK